MRPRKHWTQPRLWKGPLWTPRVRQSALWPAATDAVVEAVAGGASRLYALLALVRAHTHAHTRQSVLVLMQRLTDSLFAAPLGG